MIDSALAAIASSRDLAAALYGSPIALLLCITLLPGVVALAVLSYIYSKEAKQEEAQEHQEEENTAPGTALARSISNRRWLAGRYVPRALDRAVLRSIPLREFSGDTAEQTRGSCCVVCLAPFQAAELLKVLPPCQHAFHVACIDEWFDSYSTCPICRCHVTAPSENAVQPQHDVTLDIVVT